MTITILTGCCLSLLGTLPENHFHTCVTSPPYFQLRDYEHPAQIGRETTPEQYISNLVCVFQKVRRTLRNDGTLWVNLGDAYRDKQLLGLPWRLALALQADGWLLRSECIWHKPNAMPSSVKDRPATSHEHIFLLSKQPAYYYDHESVKEPLAEGSDVAYRANLRKDKQYDAKAPYAKNMPASFDLTARTRRTVWSVNTVPFEGAHIAPYPADLIEPCILAGSPPAGHVRRSLCRSLYHRSRR